MNFRDFIYEGSGRLWREALQNPGAMVDWIIVRPSDVSDEVSHTIDMNSPAFLAQFTLVLQEPDGIYLYHHTGRPPLPMRPAPLYVLTEHRLCGTQNRSKSTS